MFSKTRTALLLVSIAATVMAGCAAQPGSEGESSEGAMMADEQPPMSMDSFLASGFVSTANLEELIDPSHGIYVLDNPGVMTTVDHYRLEDFQRGATPEGSAATLKEKLRGGIRVPKATQVAVPATPHFDCEQEAYVPGDGSPARLPSSAVFVTELRTPPSRVSDALKFAAEIDGAPLDAGELSRARGMEKALMYSVVIPSKRLTLYFGGHPVRDAWVLMAVDLTTPCSG